MQHTNIRKGNWVEVIQKDGKKAIGQVYAAYVTGEQLYSVICDGVFKNYRGHEVIGKVKKPV
jgi:hypothetical protein